MRVSLANSDRNFSVAPDQSLLDAGLGAGLNLSHQCRGGNCGACRARLLRGEIGYPNGTPLGLSAAERSEGSILLCQARAVTDITLEILELHTPDATLVKRLPSRIERIERLSHDVLGVFLRLPAAESFRFEPGQYVDIMLPGGRRRSFSIASPPHDSRLLELHVRRVPGGEFSESLFTGSPRHALLSIEGPLGRFFYRGPTDAPMLLVAGGTGLAPLKSILRHVIENGLNREMVLYWGVRSERDLYSRDMLEDWERRVPGFRCQLVLSEPEDGWSGRRGWVHDAVLSDIPAFHRYDVYASGPPGMIAAVRLEFSQRGANLDRLFFDSFDYASDSIERHRSMAVTKS